MPNLCFLFYYFLAPSGLCQPAQSTCCQWRFGMVISSSVYMNGMARQLEGSIVGKFAGWGEHNSWRESYGGGDVLDTFRWSWYKYKRQYWVVYLTFFDIHVTVQRGKFLIIKPTRFTDFSNLFLQWNSTCFGQFHCTSSGVYHCTHSNGIWHTGLLTACEQEHMLLLESSQQTCMTHTIAVCTVKTPDDGQRNCPKHNICGSVHHA